MYLYCSDCDVKVTIMWIKFEKKKKRVNNDLNFSVNVYLYYVYFLLVWHLQSPDLDNVSCTVSPKLYLFTNVPVYITNKRLTTSAMATGFVPFPPR